QRGRAPRRDEEDSWGKEEERVRRELHRPRGRLRILADLERREPGRKRPRGTCDRFEYDARRPVQRHRLVPAPRTESPAHGLEEVLRRLARKCSLSQAFALWLPHPEHQPEARRAKLP